MTAPKQAPYFVHAEVKRKFATLAEATEYALTFPAETDVTVTREPYL